MTTYIQADTAAGSLVTLLGTQPWLLSIGVGRIENDFHVQVAVSDTVIPTIPATVGGVPVKVVTREIPKAL